MTIRHGTAQTHRLKSLLLTLAITVLLPAAGNVYAGGEIPWQSLSPEEQQALQPYRNRWDDYSSRRQREMRHGARRYMQLSPQKRREVEQQRHRYQQLSPEERHRLREQYRQQED